MTDALFVQAAADVPIMLRVAILLLDYTYEFSRLSIITLPL